MQTSARSRPSSGPATRTSTRCWLAGGPGRASGRRARGRLRDRARPAPRRAGRRRQRPVRRLSGTGRPTCHAVCAWTPSWSAAGWPGRREHASELIAAGRVKVGGAVATKAATEVDHRRRPRGRPDPDAPRLRLARRPQAGRRARGVRAARARASAAGAAWTPAPPPAGSPTCCCGPAPRRCVAVDVGYGQLAWSLQQRRRG